MRRSNTIPQTRHFYIYNCSSSLSRPFLQLWFALSNIKPGLSCPLLSRARWEGYIFLTLYSVGAQSSSVTIVEKVHNGRQETRDTAQWSLAKDILRYRLTFHWHSNGFRIRYVCEGAETVGQLLLRNASNEETGMK